MSPFPTTIEPPPGFRPVDPSTWPQIDGHLEYVDGKLLRLPPSGGEHAMVACDVAASLGLWVQKHPDHIAGCNPGMQLGSDVRSADAAIWTRADLGRPSFRFPSSPPVLVVEVANQHKTERYLQEKLRWYFRKGVKVVVWVLPESREVVVLRPRGRSRAGHGDTITIRELPDFTLKVDDVFAQLDR